MVKCLKCLVLLYCFALCTAERTIYQELVETLFRNYSNVIRPVRNHSQPTDVLLEMKIIKLIELDTRHEFIKLFAWYTEIWFDDFLYWDPDAYEGIRHIFVDPKQIWKPDTYIAESLNMDLDESVRPQPVRIDTFFPTGQRTASVRVAYPVIYEFSCKIIVEDFPYDRQSCKVIVFSWTRDATELKYTSKIPFTGYFYKNLQWTLTNVSVDYVINVYEMQQATGEYLPMEWSEVYWTFEFQRKAGFFVITLIVPTAILVQACFLGIFTLSQSDGTRTEKVTLGITTILSLSILMLVVGDLVPRASKPRPKINNYFVVEMVLMAMALVFSEIIIYIHYHGISSGQPVPRFLQYIVCMAKREKGKQMKGKKSVAPIETYIQRRYNGDPQMLDEIRKIQARMGNLTQAINAAVNGDDSKEKRESDWNKAVMRLEIICFLIFAICSVVDTLIFVYSHPTMKEEYVPPEA